MIENWRNWIGVRSRREIYDREFGERRKAFGQEGRGLRLMRFEIGRAHV